MKLISEIWTDFVLRLSHYLSLFTICLIASIFTTHLAIDLYTLIGLTLCNFVSIWLMCTLDFPRPAHRKECDMSWLEQIKQLAYRGTQGLETFLSSPGLPVYVEDDE